MSDKALNAMLSSARSVVEHALAGVKRARIVKDEFRNTKPGFSDVVLDVACALHNLRCQFRHPVPALDILALSG